jgi:hypothetical protein
VERSAGGSRSRLAASLVLAVLSLGTASRPQALRPLGPDLAALVHDAIADRFAAGNIPDLSLIEDRTHVFVLNELRAARAMLTEDALPQMEKTTFELISLEEAETKASQSGREVPYIAVDEPRIDGAAGTLSLGVDIALPRVAGMIKMCCCAGRAEFRRTPERWVFQKWAQMTCS